ncbi:MAG: hypothetical protein ACO3D0_10710, partial [Ilumatobacteraceae bacterium]
GGVEEPRHHRPRVFDTSMAFLAGDRVWRDPVGSTPSPRERVPASVLVMSLGVTALTTWALTSTRLATGTRSVVADRDSELVIVALGGTAAALALAIHPLGLALGRAPRPTRFWWSVGWRSVAYLALTGSLAAAIPDQRFLGAIPLGIVTGTDAVLTIWVLGLRPRPVRWSIRALTSGVHFGAIGALIGTTVFDPDGVPVATAASVYGAMWALIGVTGATVVVSDRLSDIADARFDEERRDLRTKEREMRVHWMHDDVLTEVKLAKLRVESSSDASAALREFDELDHRLRLRQLDESLRGGDVPLYEILQPHLRRVQSAGVRIERVPSLDQSSMRVDEETGRTIHRAVGNLVSNAITAGATTLSVSLLEHLDPHRVEISVTDDAGGFSLDDVEPGRGLWLLRRDLGDDAVEVVPVPDGSIVSVHVRLGPPADHRTQGAADDRRPRGDVLR